jgi:hypothetical protein
MQMQRIAKVAHHEQTLCVYAAVRFLNVRRQSSWYALV